jgi:hypothetical protein
MIEMSTVIDLFRLSERPLAGGWYFYDNARDGISAAPGLPYFV